MIRRALAMVLVVTVVIGGGMVVNAEIQPDANYDTTVGVVLSNKLLAELEPIAMYRVGETQPVGYCYEGFNKCGKSIVHLDSNLAVKVAFYRRGCNSEVRVTYIPNTGEICYRSVRPFKLRYRASRKVVTVKVCGCLSVARQHRIINSFKYQVRARNLNVCSPRIDKPRKVKIFYRGNEKRIFLNGGTEDFVNDIGWGG